MCGVNCEKVGSGGFACSNGKCIMAEYKCDGYKECDDWSDDTTEVCGVNCELIPGGGFACSNGQCVPAHWKCDGGRHGDCDDGSDETEWGCSQVTFWPNNKA